ncbi:MAG TPA: family 43 glycosylhydrolase [Clostridiales bacterium]|nr:family 43 glycosylhydrolase [Clostridiales bacterium]
MKTEEINIRDPYILCSNRKYYLYGTRSATTWGLAEGFDCYESSDLENWEGPFEIFHRQEDFLLDRAYWAPECYEIDGKYYLITTLGSENKKKAVYALVSDSPKGPFLMHSDGALTPEGWCCIDGSLHFEGDGRLYLIFSHSFEDVPTGDMVAVELSRDLKRAVSGPRVLFNAVTAPWAKPVPFAKAEFNMDGDVYFTDGPCAYRLKDKTLMIVWSSWTEQGYGVGMAVSGDGTIGGEWRHQEEKLYPGNGGHGMIFCTYEGDLKYLMHYPNDIYQERPCFFDLVEEQGRLKLVRG